MAVPSVKELRRPVLELLSNSGGGLNYPNLVDQVVSRFSLTQDDRQQMMAGDRRPLLLQNTYTLIYYLRRDELVSPPDGGKTIRISSKGRELLLEADGTTGASLVHSITPTESLVDTSPEQRMFLGYSEHHEMLLDEVLDSVRSIDPTSFERLVVELMERMGYGYSVVTQRSHDGGIDGILTKDHLGLQEKVCVQAKRYGDGSSVGLPAIREFAGSLDDYHTDHGVFITAASFASTVSRGAKAQIATVGNNSIRLIDGRGLAELMIEHGVGVVTETTYEVKKLDTNYFAEV